MVATTYNTTTESLTISATAADASSNVLYTCPANHDASIDMLIVSNNNTSTKKAYIQFYHADTTTYHYLVKDHSIAGNTTYNVLENSTMHLHAGDKITLYGQTTNTLEATISLKEFYNPNR